MHHTLRLATVAALAVLAAVAPAAAQEPAAPPSSAPAESSTTTTTATTDTTAPADAGDQDAPPATAPDTDVTVPPPPGEPVDPAAAEELIRRETEVARAEVMRSAADVEAAARRVDEVADRLAAQQEQLARVDVARQEAVSALEAAEVRFRERVANAVVRGNAAELDTLVNSVEPNLLERRKVLLSSVSEADSDAVTELRQAEGVLDQGLLEAIDGVSRTRRELREARAALEQALRLNTEHKFELAVLSAGSEIVIRGFVFPVAEPYSFIDSWGYPRMTGTEYEHGHEGVDIMAPSGTPLYAVERGVVTRVGTDVLGGTKLWLKGQSGTHYYYAHLAEYAAGVAEGAVVEAGDVVGFVGDTGNAKGGAPHLHFQLHPDGGEPVNPYGLLRVVSELSRN